MTADTSWTAEDESMMFDTIDRWCRDKVRPKVMDMEHADEYPHDFVEDMKEFGLFGATIGQDYGGLGLSARFYAKIVTRISEEWMSLTGIFNSHIMMATVVEKYGTDFQKEYWLPKFTSGEIRGALGLTEPNAGTDLQAIRTIHLRDGIGQTHQQHFRIAALSEYTNIMVFNPQRSDRPDKAGRQAFMQQIFGRFQRGVGRR